MIKIIGRKNKNDVIIFECFEWTSTSRAVGYWQKMDSNYIDNNNDNPNCADSLECVLLGREADAMEFLRIFFSKIHKQDSNENSKE